MMTCGVGVGGLNRNKRHVGKRGGGGGGWGEK